jgi:uncharacterized protein
MTSVLLASLLSIMVASQNSARPSRPSFDCSDAKSPDEATICSHDKLARLDGEIAVAAKGAGGYRTGHDGSNDLDYLKERRNCGSDAACILDVQAREVSILNSDRMLIPMPKWIGSYRLSLLRGDRTKFVASLPKAIGACTRTKIVGITSRSGDPTKLPEKDVNFRMSVEYDDNGFQISFGYVADLAASFPGDDVVLCLDAVPQYCLWNEHVKIFSATNIRTKGSWIMPDPNAQQICETGAYPHAGYSDR